MAVILSYSNEAYIVGETGFKLVYSFSNFVQGFKCVCVLVVPFYFHGSSSAVIYFIFIFFYLRSLLVMTLLYFPFLCALILVKNYL